jgi:hypothetical protein
MPCVLDFCLRTLCPVFAVCHRTWPRQAYGLYSVSDGRFYGRLVGIDIGDVSLAKTMIT